MTSKNTEGNEVETIVESRVVEPDELSINNPPKEVIDQIERMIAWWQKELPPMTDGALLSTRMSW